ncbi:hypothetical protein L1987_60993 [Smallanthus sonchifolius]|uniref:Uncharacterized protein n=1 Tax=Smallanthus sonchifolius TaxID=185202 RepID=A0ACB9D9L8_9ASTR|nr:hypothetical protein L1987_60993 [Smallanthus sonchifolius]
MLHLLWLFVLIYGVACLAQARNDDPLIVGRVDLDPPIPAGYFGNCIVASVVATKTTVLTGKEGFITAAKLIGEKLHKFLMDKDGILAEKDSLEDLFPAWIPTTIIEISGTPKLRLYDMDFGWGRPKEFESVMIDYSAAISIDAGKESDQDFEVGVCLTPTQMHDFDRIFKLGLELHSTFRISSKYFRSGNRSGPSVAHGSGNPISWNCATGPGDPDCLSGPTACYSGGSSGPTDS